MKMVCLVLLLLATQFPLANAQECPAGKSYEDARAVVRDLQRIVTPTGVDESYTTTIGGIKQWINVRGQDRSNPIILFVHGGPAAPLAPSIWEFQHHNAQAIAELNSIAPYPGDMPITRERIIIARKWPQFYGGLSAYRDGGAKYYFDAPLLSPAYDCKAARAVDQGNLFTLGRILPEFLQVDLKPVHKFPIPVVMFMGRHDYTTPSAPTAAWLEQVDAPYKKGIWFEHSAHMIPWEEPGKTLQSLVEYVRPLASRASR